MMQLAFIIEEAFAVEHNYEEIGSAIKAIASQIPLITIHPGSLQMRCLKSFFVFRKSGADD